LGKITEYFANSSAGLLWSKCAKTGLLWSKCFYQSRYELFIPNSVQYHPQRF